MNAINVSLPNSLHKHVIELAEKESISVNQLIILALAEKMSALMTEEYIQKRVERGNRTKFEAAMKKVAKIEPEEYDRL